MMENVKNKNPVWASQRKTLLREEDIQERIHRISTTAPQSLILNPLGQMSSGIQNSLDLVG